MVSRREFAIRHVSDWSVRNASCLASYFWTLGGNNLTFSAHP